MLIDSLAGLKITYITVKCAVWSVQAFKPAFYVDYYFSLNCGNHSEEDVILTNNFHYWLEGVGMVRNHFSNFSVKV